MPEADNDAFDALNVAEKVNATVTLNTLRR